MYSAIIMIQMSFMPSLFSWAIYNYSILSNINILVGHSHLVELVLLAAFAAFAFASELHLQHL